MEYKSKISDRRKTKLILSLRCSIEENLTHLLKWRNIIAFLS